MCTNGMLKNNDAAFFSLAKLGVVLHVGSVELQLLFMTGHEPNHASETTIRAHQWNQKEKDNSLMQQVWMTHIYFYVYNIPKWLDLLFCISREVLSNITLLKDLFGLLKLRSSRVKPKKTKSSTHLERHRSFRVPQVRLHYFDVWAKGPVTWQRKQQKKDMGSSLKLYQPYYGKNTSNI